MSFSTRILLGLLLASMLAVPVFAADDSAYIRIDQPSPDSRTFITATFALRTTCSQIPVVKVNGPKIVIDATTACLSSFDTVPLSVNIGTLPGGVYDVIGVGLLGGGEVHTPLVVRDVDPFRVFPPGGSIAGGTEIRIWSGTTDPQPIAVDSVTFDGVPATAVSYGAFTAFKTPGHLAGDVDVVVSIRVQSLIQPYSERYTLRAGYRYFDPAAAPDPFLFERVLFPIKYEGNGAYGSQWTTDNRVGVSWMAPPLFVELWRPPCSTCPLRLDNKAATSRVPEHSLDKGNSASGSLLYAFRGTTNALRTSSRIRDLSRQAESAGTEISVVFEKDFNRIIDLLDIPTDSRFRATLRVWSDDATSSPNAVVYNAKGSATVPLKFAPSSVDALPFASADLTPYLAPLAAGASANVQITTSAGAGVWAMVSITNNETQEVTIISPR